MNEEQLTASKTPQQPLKGRVDRGPSPQELGSGYTPIPVAKGSRRTQPLQQQRGRYAPDRDIARKRRYREFKAAVSESRRFDTTMRTYQFLLSRAGLADAVSISTLDYWARAHVTYDQLETAIKIAKRKRPDNIAALVCGLVRNHIRHEKPWHSLDRASMTPDMDKLRSHTYRAGWPWSEREDDDLRKMVNRHQPIQKIARTLHRTPVAIQGRIVKVFGGPVRGYPIYPEQIPSESDWYRAPTLADLRASVLDHADG